MQEAFGRMEQYMLQRRDEAPRGDVIDAILALDFEGFDWESKVMTLTTLTLGGIGTTGYVIASALHFLATHAEERRALMNDPTAWETAIEEFLRFFPSSPHDGRRLTEPKTIGGVDFAEGDYVVIHFGAANRDPSVFDSPEQLGISRALPNRHMTFGYGIHRCLGSHLARLEIRVALEEFLKAFPDYGVPQASSPSTRSATPGSSSVFPSC